MRNPVRKAPKGCSKLVVSRISTTNLNWWRILAINNMINVTQVFSMYHDIPLYSWCVVLEIDLKSPGYVLQVKLIQSQGTTMFFTSIACIQYDMTWHETYETSSAMSIGIAAGNGVWYFYRLPKNPGLKVAPTQRPTQHRWKSWGQAQSLVSVWKMVPFATWIFWGLK